MSNRRTRRCNIRAPNWISRRPFFHACRAVFSLPPLPPGTVTAKKEVKQTREGWWEEGGREWGAQAVAIGNPTASRPMPRRLYRFTTERRTSVNRYLLTLDFPWPPPRTRLLPLPPPHSHNPYGSPSFPVTASLSLAFCSACLLPTFRPSSTTIATLLRAVGRRGVRATGQGVGDR